MYNNQLPLIDLHRHLDGNIRPQTIWQLAQKNNITLPEINFEKFLPHVTITHNEADLLAFLKKLDWGVKVLSTLDDCKRIAFENVEDVYQAGIRYAELRFSPYYMAMTHQLPVADVVAAVIDGVAQGVKQFPVKINLIGILSRTFGVEICQQELDALLTHKNHLVAIDLAGDEYNFPGHLFVEHFTQVKNADLHITVHAGEAAGPESVWQAINDLGATRIGHGVNSYKDESLMAYMHKHSIGVESCLTSNLQTGTVKHLNEHPITTFIENQLLVCLNTDDPAVEGIELKHEFELAHQSFNFDLQTISQLQQNAIDMSFLSNAEKRTLTSEFTTKDL
ncbi:adenosine deaminase [Thalassotalea sp. PLHSN55]|uniref:adenosine deaminase n=1 Tax=Thalassotalea sp. PLHSN55 TaxID=3435888 RepID=UPI003F858FE0